MTPDVRVLVTMGGIPLYGQERGNIQVFHVLREVGVDALFVTNEEYGHENIQPALDALGFRWSTANYPGRWTRGKGARWLLKRAQRALQTNKDFLREARRYRPTHVHTMSERFAVDLLPAFRLLRRPIVYRVGDAPQQHRAAFRLVWKYGIAPTVHTFVANSEFIRSRLLDAGVPDRKIRVIYTYPPDRPPRSATDLPEDLLRPFDGRTAVYMGQISEEKGASHFVDAARELCRERDDVRFLLAGKSNWRSSFASELKARVEAAELTDRIRFLGYVEDVDGLLALADVHAAPSVWEEPLANTVLEAKRAGVPTVLFPSGGLPELVVDNGLDTYACPEKTSVALAEGLRHFVSMSQAQLDAAGQAAAKSMVTLGITRDAFTRAWADVYDAL